MWLPHVYLMVTVAVLPVHSCITDCNIQLAMISMYKGFLHVNANSNSQAQWSDRVEPSCQQWLLPPCAPIYRWRWSSRCEVSSGWPCWSVERPWSLSGNSLKWPGCHPLLLPQRMPERNACNMAETKLQSKEHTCTLSSLPLYYTKCTSLAHKGTNEEPLQL